MEPEDWPDGMALDAWAQARWSDITARELDHSLEVGPSKPLGSFRVLARPDAEAQLRERAGVRWMFMPAADGHGEFVHAWHEVALGELLQERARVLLRARWPREPAPFVARVRKETVRPLTPLFVLVADAYGDKTGPGRPDVLPGVERAELLKAFVFAHGFEDPTAFYFDLSRGARRGGLQ